MAANALSTYYLYYVYHVSRIIIVWIRREQFCTHSIPNKIFTLFFQKKNWYAYRYDSEWKELIKINISRLKNNKKDMINNY